MGNYLTTPKTEKESDNGRDELCRYGLSSMQGWRISMEDSHLACLNPFAEFEGLRLFGVFDGHGGGHVSKFVANHMLEEIRNTEGFSEEQWEPVLQHAFITVDRLLFQEQHQDELAKYMGRGDVADDDSLMEEVFPQAVSGQREQASASQAQDETSEKEAEDSGGARASADGDTTTENADVADEEDDYRQEGGGEINSEGSGGAEGVGASHADESGEGESDGCGGEEEEDEKNEQPAAAESGGGRIRKGRRARQSSGDTAEGGGVKMPGRVNRILSASTEKFSGTARRERRQEKREKKEAERAERAAAKEDGGNEKGEKKHGFGRLRQGLAKHGSKDVVTVAANTAEGEVDSSAAAAGEAMEDKTLVDSGGGGGGFLGAIKSAVQSVFSFGKQNLWTPLTGDSPAFKSRAWFAGSTSIVVVLSREEVIVANAGDSRCVMCRGSFPLELSMDHKPTLAAERERVAKAGGFLEQGRVNGNLNLSRAMGDLAYKDPRKNPAETIITAFPDVKRIEITEEDEFLVIGCDGIWEKMDSSKMVIDFVRARISSTEKLSDIVEELFEELLSPNPNIMECGCDNMTAIIVDLKPNRKIVPGPVRQAERRPFAYGSYLFEADKPPPKVPGQLGHQSEPPVTTRAAAAEVDFYPAPRNVDLHTEGVQRDWSSEIGESGGGDSHQFHPHPRRKTVQGGSSRKDMDNDEEEDNKEATSDGGDAPVAAGSSVEDGAAPTGADTAVASE